MEVALGIKLVVVLALVSERPVGLGLVTSTEKEASNRFYSRMLSLEAYFVRLKFLWKS